MVAVGWGGSSSIAVHYLLAAINLTNRLKERSVISTGEAVELFFGGVKPRK
jgi:hypothetical protein